VRATPTGGSEIFTMNADGSNQRNRSKNEFQDFQPAWSPSGDQIAFVSSRTGGGDTSTG
jgi:Tol biopolymer transport system component